jgi:hypothetical protein
LRLRVECTIYCNLQSRARTHAALVIGIYELLGNPTTKLIEPLGTFHLMSYGKVVIRFIGGTGDRHYSS